jgi:phosphoribosyl 1,2-cyclic phosphodiesterase
VCGPDVARHGGATTHLELDLGDGIPYDRILIDCGTGIVGMAQENREDIENALVLQTHMHWDHIQGFPFFDPFFDPSASFDFLGVDREGESVEEIYAAQMRKPTFPVGMDAICADLSFERIPKRGERQIGNATVSWTELEHPSGSSAFRVECDGEVFVFSGDVEVRQGSADRLVEFAAGADALLMDAQYLPGEYDDHEGFGHSTCLDAVRVAERAEVDAVYFTHHDPAHDDSALDAKLRIARDEADDDLTVDNAADRQEIPLGEPSDRISPESDAVAE